jgi:hypothetical protein
MHSRRHVIRKGLSLAFASTAGSAEPTTAAAPPPRVAAQTEIVVTPEMFGARGDGVANDLGAWRSALAAARLRGRPLGCRPGAIYNWGEVLGPEPLISLEAADLTIEGNGAQVRVHTGFEGIGAPITLSWPRRVRVANLRFTDTGFDPAAVWKGSHFLLINAPAVGEAGNIHLENCEATSALGFLTLGSGAETGRLRGIRLEGRNRAVRCFYGLSCQAQGDEISGSLDCTDVRRAYIAYGCSRHSLDLNIHSSGGRLGSNGCIEIASMTHPGLRRTDTSDIQIRARTSGDLKPYGAVVLFQLQSDTGTASLKRIDVQLDLQGARTPVSTQSFAFRSFDLQSREPAVAEGVWDAISVSGDYVRHGQPFAIKARPVAKGRLRISGRPLAEQQTALLMNNFQVEDLTDRS